MFFDNNNMNYIIKEFNSIIDNYNILTNTIDSHYDFTISEYSQLLEVAGILIYETRT